MRDDDEARANLRIFVKRGIGYAISDLPSRLGFFDVLRMYTQVGIFTSHSKLLIFFFFFFFFFNLIFFFFFFFFFLTFSFNLPNRPYLAG